MTIEVTYDRPIPDARKPGRPRLYPFNKMRVGGSFFVAGALYQTLKGSVAWFQKHQNEDPKWKFRILEDEVNGVRGMSVWRIS